MIFTYIHPTTGHRELRQHVAYVLDESTMVATCRRSGRVIARFHHQDVEAAKAHLATFTEPASPKG